MQSKIFYSFLLLIVAAYAVTDIIAQDRTAQIFGIKGYRIVTDSMSGLYEAGDIVFVTSVASKDIKVGDAITFKVKNLAVTHRVAAIITNENEIAFRTQTNGDFVKGNDKSDAWVVHSNDIIGKVFFSISKPILICGEILAGIILNVFIIYYFVNLLFPKERAEEVFFVRQ
jgi:signal peptidase I